MTPTLRIFQHRIFSDSVVDVLAGLIWPLLLLKEFEQMTRAREIVENRILPITMIIAYLLFLVCVMRLLLR